MNEFENRVFNRDPSLLTETYKPIFMGPPRGLFDSVNRPYPKIHEIYKKLKSADWNETDNPKQPCLIEFETVDPEISDMMITNIAYQWETDSVAARMVNAVLAPFITAEEAQCAYTRIADNENLHALTYSDIVKVSFKDPTVVIKRISEMEEIKDRLKTVTEVLAKCYDYSTAYARGLIPNNQDTYNYGPFMFVVTMLIIERIQFMASFAITAAITRNQVFQPIGKDIQKIAKDELEFHVEMGKEVLRIELATERGLRAFNQCRELILKVLNEVRMSEHAFIDFITRDGTRELTGYNRASMKKGVDYLAADVYNFLGLELPYEMPDRNPLIFLDKWINISDTQRAPMEEQTMDYPVGGVINDDEGVVFKF